MNIEKVVKKIQRGIRLKVKSAKKDGVVLGLSGGLDSTVVGKLCFNALGADRVYGVMLPLDYPLLDKNRDTTGIDFLEFKNLEEMPLSHFIHQFSKYTFHFKDKLTKGNLIARIRMCILYGIANEKNLLVAGTSNKSELLIGYFTKFGDGASDFLPIGDLYKTEVIEVAKYLKIPENIINKKPSAGLWEGQTDEDEIGMSYELLDKILNEIYKPLFDRGYEKAINRVAKELEIDIKTVWKVANLIDSSYHKRKPPKTIPLRRGVESKIIGE